MRLDTKLLIGLCALIFQVGCGKSSFNGSSDGSSSTGAAPSVSSDGSTSVDVGSDSSSSSGGVLTGRLLEMSSRIPQVGVQITVMTMNGVFNTSTDANGYYSVSLPSTTIDSVIANNLVDFVAEELPQFTTAGIPTSENPNIDLFSAPTNASSNVDASAGSLAPYSISGVVENAAGQAVSTTVVLLYHTPSLNYGTQTLSFGPAGFNFSVAGGANAYPEDNYFSISAPNHSYAAVVSVRASIDQPLVLSR